MFIVRTALSAAFLGLALASPAAALDLNREAADLIDTVNRGVNREFRAMAAFDDPNGDGVWDCENYGAEKRARLIAAGVPAADLSLMRVFTTRGVSHAVLIVRAERAGKPVALVLDNLSQWATPRERLPYTGWETMPVLAGQAALDTADTLRARP